GAATRAAEAVRERLAAAGRVATDWARLRLARDLLEQAVQRHAQRAQGPMLAAATRWFARLTGGRWRDLRPDWSGDVQVLAAERDDGVRLQVHQLSEGAADALFLALRMAAIEVRLASAPPVPLLLDDVLASFDDTRAALALDALAELGQRNQVVYFTHHAHLVELARRTVPAGRVAVRELEHRALAA
ncbi:MAG: chromosome segregation protein SMC, partial [Burkholderiaceae bacterium]|nr:chromosome segregation protein SMC [Burkholderiaceae bacterium]